MIAAASIIASAIFIYGQNSLSEANVLVEGQGGQRWRFPLNTSEILEVAGPLGSTTIELLDGSIRVCDSPCNNKSCILAGAISRPGAWNACLPNQVLITIENGSRKQNNIDAVSW